MDEKDIKQALLERGVTIRCPDSVDIDASINPLRIAPGTTIHSGSRLSGDQTSIGPGSILGEEAPLTLHNCQLGHDVRLKGGFFSGATLMNGVTFGSGAHVRAGTLLEDYASCAHTVGLKQTILMPFVTLGSLINFCDCLMAGGTSAKDHSEVGSSYIHFNFTAHQDKATPSMAGEVPQGVMLDQPPIFLGGQGGLVGPTRITYGTILAAGTICRRDVLNRGKLVFGQTGHRVKEYAYDPSVFGEIDRICHNNFIYIGNLHALDSWYEHVRPLLAGDDVYAQACLEGARQQLAAAVAERVKQLNRFADKLADSLKHSQGEAGTFANHRRFVDQWPATAPRLALPTSNTDSGNANRDRFLSAVTQLGRGDYIGNIQSLPSDAKAEGTAWLQGIVDSIGSIWGAIKYV
jgi:bifunctional UDP-N-acetylglucosamine pyrophosphorylase/glucosamine-1-phosphate N-acetyltransferase